LDIVDRHNLIVLIEDLGRDLAGDDAFKQRHRLVRKVAVATGQRARAGVSEHSTGVASSANAPEAMKGFIWGAFPE
jgi:hypothetical protein